uniref:Uncharacterized protein n=1 Tax=Rhizophora mucronata TaxID=61149 RepID=A0A2P2Q439_RHIMU
MVLSKMRVDTKHSQLNLPWWSWSDISLSFPIFMRPGDNSYPLTCHYHKFSTI